LTLDKAAKSIPGAWCEHAETLGAQGRAYGLPARKAWRRRSMWKN